MHIDPEILIMLPVLFFSIICHEVAHGYAAWRGGDDTARLLGRLSFNPLVHIDPVGSILLPAMLAFSGSRFMLGWAKPVPINPARFRSRKWILIVSLAGVTVNFLLAFAAMVLLRLFWLVGLGERLSPNPSALNPFDIASLILQSFVIINLVLMVFNSLPIPPLDGSHVLFYFIRTRDSALFQVFAFIERYGMFLLLLLVVTGGLSHILFPILYYVIKALCFILQMPEGAL